MEFHYSLTGGQGPVHRDMTVRHGGTNVVTGALVVRGATPGTNGGMVIVSGAAMTDAVGVLLEALASSATDSTILGTTENRRKVLMVPNHAVLSAEYNTGTANDLAVTSASTTTLTITDLEDNIDGAFILLVNSSAGINNSLRYVTASQSGSCTLKSAFTTDPVSTDNIVKILPRLHQLAVIVTDASQLSTTAAVGTARCVVLDNYLVADGIPSHVLDPVADSPRNVMSNPRVYADITLSNSGLMPLD